MSVRHKMQHQFGCIWVRGVYCRPLEPHLIPGCPAAPLNLLKVPTEITWRSYDSLTPWIASLGPHPHPKVYISPSTIAWVTEDWWSSMLLHHPSYTLNTILPGLGTEQTSRHRAEYPGHPQQFWQCQNSINAWISDHFCFIWTRKPLKLGG